MMPLGRRGSVYVAVMATAFIVSFVGLAGLTAARLHLKSTGDGFDRGQAGLLAAAAIEHAVAEFQQNADWRTTYVAGTEYPSRPVAVNGGTFTWRLVDLGGGRQRLDGIGRVGGAEAIHSVDLRPPGSPSLECALLSGRDLEITSAGEALTASGAPVATNATLRNSGIITADVQAQMLVNSGVIVGAQTVPGPVRTLPDASEVFDYYLARGTLLDTAAFTGAGGDLSIRGVVLSPFSNPFGATNAEGIYIVDCRGRKFQVSESRIVGTLVVLDPDPSDMAHVRREINWEPAFPHYPALLVRGNLRIRITNLLLSETTVNANFNPPGTPWKGQTDSVLDDAYPSSIGGLVYASGDIRFDGNSTLNTIALKGLVVAGGACRVSNTASVTIEYDPAAAANPPPGFGGSAGGAIRPGTWRRTASE